MRAIEEMVEKLSPLAWRISFRILADREAAEDAAQEVMVKVWRNIGQMRDERGFSSWFYRIVVNCCYDEIRRRKKITMIKADDITWGLLSEQFISDNEGETSISGYEEIIRTITSELSPVQKAVFVLSDLEGMDNRQISVITGKSLNSVKSNLHYARKRIMEIVRGRF
jgi:RNA polymerase sigma-70 factor, ECF subfamily